MWSCEGVQEDNYEVFVTFPTTLAKRCRDCCPVCWDILQWLYIIFLVSVFVFVMFSCLCPPRVALRDMTIRDMVVYHNTSATPNSSQWQVNSDINITLYMRNNNTVPGCFTSFPRMVVSVKFKDHLVSLSVIPLGFSLKSGRSRGVSAELKGEHFQVTDELGPVLDAELRSDNVTLELNIDTRYFWVNRNWRWTHKVCKVVGKTPLECSRLGSLLSKHCD